MNDKIQFLLSRRSIRRYIDKPVEQDKIETILRVAMSAPSAGNEQAWQFLVVLDKSKMLKITEFHPYASMLKNAAVAIVVVGDTNKTKYGGIGKEYWIQDCSAATQNILLAAHALGLGAVWLGVHPMPERVNRVRELFGLSKELIPFSIVSIGYPDQSSQIIDRYKEENVKYFK